MHSGGTTALFPPRFWQFQHKNHTPTQQQKALFSHFKKCADHAAQERKGRRLVIVHDGDAIDGYHHQTEQVVTHNKQEQSEVHIELMDYFMRAAKFGKGDELYYVSGTAVHTSDVEHDIAKDLGAKGRSVHDHLELTINKKRLWFAHHGKGRGQGANEGNGLRNFLRNVYHDCKKRETQPPDYIITGHTHTPTWNTYIAREKKDFFEMHGIICPSWQMKTRYGYMVAPVDANEVGAVFLKIDADGTAYKPKFMLMDTQ
jgi:hypothetical protein